jgi:hypothetical protein
MSPSPDHPPGLTVGLQPWFPWPLSRWRWLTAPVRAERLAAVRIALALCALVDVLTTYLPMSGLLFGPDSLGPREMFDYRFKDGLRWSVLYGGWLSDDWTPGMIRGVMWVWAASLVLLLVGAGTRWAAIVAWALSVSVANVNEFVDNAGDTVRTLALFVLMLSPCGAAWSVDAWFARRFRWAFGRPRGGGPPVPVLRRREQPLHGPFWIFPWPLCLLLVQMMVIYLFNGLFKAGGDTWHNGESLYYVLGDLTLARVSYAQLTVPYWMTRVLTWMVLWWELLFVPLMLVPWKGIADRVEKVSWAGLGNLHVLFRWNREIVLVFGALFHLGIWVSMELGGFGPYMLCLYMPFLPWERFGRGRKRQGSAEGEQGPPGDTAREGAISPDGAAVKSPGRQPRERASEPAAKP